jgi:hypothetical protein
MWVGGPEGSATRAPVSPADAGHATAFEHFQDLHRIMVETVVPATYSAASP